MKRAQHIIEPVRKSRTVALDVAEAFDLFTIRIGSWWPLSGFSISEDPSSRVRFEPRVGGRVVEVTPGGAEHAWADVIAWDPPHRFVLAWHPAVEPEAATILEVRFTSSPEGGTDVELEHRAWEELGDDDGPRVRAGYDSGWDVVLEPFEAATASATAS